ncbi:hypothetical protein LTR09_000131 [Extremus antarcticus]|uniref:Aminoglycoside phosphotransferase domain-containing protein n=1 Tax=Extremus antarcticus TaxID=702011 RepID=A0AAJ0GJ19_9PEZI|nr:hypothetical protein LTR09_000131 [Extremus antarcticus]
MSFARLDAEQTAGAGVPTLRSLFLVLSKALSPTHKPEKARFVMSAYQSTTAEATAMEAPTYILDLARQVLGKFITDAAPRAISFTVVAKPKKSTEQHQADHTVVEISFLAKGGYNDVWLARSPDKSLPSFVLRVPNEDSLKPNQIQNEVGWLRYLKTHCPDIPVPAVYDYSDGILPDEQPFIAQQYVPFPALSDVWQTYTDNEKHEVARKIAELTIHLGEQRFDAIAGMMPDGSLGPTVEGCKLFKGRSAFHTPECYDIGPYQSIKHYILTYYDKEIYYYTNAPDSSIDHDFFDQVSQPQFVQTLKAKRAAVAAELEAHPYEEPFVLCHNDLQGRNILMNGTEIAAVIDWEFAGSYPLSELEDSGIEVLEMEDDETQEECFKWSGIIYGLVKTVARERSWTDHDFQLLTSGGNRTLQEVRIEMMPADPPDAEAGAVEE